MRQTFVWCKDKTRLSIWDKQVFIVNCNGVKYWYLNGNIHRKNGPAVEYPSVDRFGYLNGELHRENGPAIEYANGDKSWFLNGGLHRENGPAIELTNGYKAWYLNGKEYTEYTYWKGLKK